MKKQVFMWLSIAMFALFIIWTILVGTVDKEVIYNHTSLGFSHLNQQFGDLATNFGKYQSMRTISDILLYASIAYSVVLVVIAVIELIKHKSLKKVNPLFYFLAGAYVLIAILYVLF